ncbi:MAG: hypothetical protein ACRCWQ_13815 [Bacilli bacterium]
MKEINNQSTNNMEHLQVGQLVMIKTDREVRESLEYIGESDSDFFMRYHGENITIYKYPYIQPGVFGKVVTVHENGVIDVIFRQKYTQPTHVTMLRIPTHKELVKYFEWKDHVKRRAVNVVYGKYEG